MHRYGIAAAMAIAAAPLAAQQPDVARLSFLDGCWSAGVPGFAASFDFSRLRSDDSGLVLVLDRGWRLAHAAGDSAVFTLDSMRLSYHREGDALIVARNGDRPQRLVRSACPRRPTMIAGMPGEPARESPGSGNTELMVFETLHGLFLGIAVPVLLDADEAAPYGLGLLLGGPAGLLLSRAWARGHQPTVGQSRAIVWGGTWGALSSLFLYQAIEDFPSASGAMGAMTAGLAGGTLFGGFVARRPISGGDGTLGIHGTFWGAAFGLGLALLADTDGEAWMPLLIGGNAGLFAAATAARRTEMSSARVWLITAAGLAGLVGGIGIDILIQADDQQTAVAIPMATALVGLGLGLSGTRDFDRGRLAIERRAPPSLLAVEAGRLRLGVPVPQPALLPRDDGRRRGFTPGVRLPIFTWR